MTRPIQKSRERSWLHLFRDLFEKKTGGGFPPGKVIEAESPDFVVERPHGCLGIEFTELVRPKHPQEEYSAAERAGFYRKIVAGARRICEQQAIPPLWVTVCIFPSRFRLRGGTAQRRVSEDIAGLVSEWIAGNPEESIGILKAEGELPGVWQILIVRGEDALDSHHWEWKPGAVWVGSVSSKTLQEELNKKGASRQRYRVRCSECWLVVVGDPCDPAKGADIRRGGQAIAHDYTSDFDRVFFLQLLDELVELRLSES